jgi:hypothetical protein
MKYMMHSGTTQRNTQTNSDVRGHVLGSAYWVKRRMARVEIAASHRLKR